MFSRRAALFTKESNASKIVKEEARDIIERKNHQRPPLSEIIGEIYSILDWIGYEELPEPVTDQSNTENNTSMSSTEDSDVIML